MGSECVTGHTLQVLINGEWVDLPNAIVHPPTLDEGDATPLVNWIPEPFEVTIELRFDVDPSLLE